MTAPAPPNPLRDRIPSGTLSGALPWLCTTGNQITTADGQPVLLRGVNLLGLDSADPDATEGFAAGAGLSATVIAEMLDWGSTVLRVAINGRRVLRGSGAWSAWDYLTDLDRIVAQAAAGGAFTLLSLRRLDEETTFGTLPGPDGERAPNLIAPHPDYDAVGIWRLLGERYADEPAVLYDLYTAPHAPLLDDLTGFTTDWDLWTLWVQWMTAELRRVHPRALCFVSGQAGGTDLSGFPVLGTAGRPIPNLVYALHLAADRSPLGRRDPWPALRALASRHPLFVTEWRAGADDVRWAEWTELALRAAGIGWTAAHLTDEPPLVRAAVPGGRGTSTRFGAVVRRALADAARPTPPPWPALPAPLAALSVPTNARDRATASD
jgi:hypothetical protein